MGSCTFEEKRKGDGMTFPKDGQRVVIQYEGRLPNGQVFDSTSWRKNNFSFRVGRGEVIRGLDENVKKMSTGSVVELTCPPEYAYGKMGYPGVYPLCVKLLPDFLVKSKLKEIVDDILKSMVF